MAHEVPLVARGIMNKCLFSGLFLSISAFAGDTSPLFSLSSPDIGPFPTDSLTALHSSQKTGKRINLPSPYGCATQPLSACADTALLNQLDGFSVNPQVHVCFNAPIAVSTLAQGLWISRAGQPASRVAVGQILYDPATQCALGKPASVLSQNQQYLFTVINTVKNVSGNSLT